MKNVASGTVLWRTPTGFGCIILPYDGRRFQLRLTWEDGTIKSDLFASYANALLAAQKWRREIVARELLASDTDSNQA